MPKGTRRSKTLEISGMTEHKPKQRKDSNKAKEKSQKCNQRKEKSTEAKEKCKEKVKRGPKKGNASMEVRSSKERKTKERKTKEKVHEDKTTTKFHEFSDKSTPNFDQCTTITQSHLDQPSSCFTNLKRVSLNCNKESRFK